MDLQKKEKLLAMGMAFTKALAAVSERFDLGLELCFLSYTFMFEDQTMCMECFYESESVEEVLPYLWKEDYTIEKFLYDEDDGTEAVILGAESLYYILYGYQAGQKYWQDSFEDDEAEALYECMTDVFDQYGYGVDLAREGIIKLYPYQADDCSTMEEISW